MTADRTVTIDLDALGNIHSSVFQEGFQSIHSKELLEGRLRAIIKQRELDDKSLGDREKNSRYRYVEPELVSRRYHDAIFIQGGRGTGKTTYLFYCLSQLQREDLEIEKGNKKKFEVLKVIDPTMIESREILLISVLSMIKERVDQRLNQTQDNGSYDRRSWMETVQKLATGVRLLDRVGKSPFDHETWDDPELSLQEALSNAQHSNKLEEAIHEFMERACEILKKDYILLSFDDADLNYEFSWDLLETIRKYLTAPHLLVIATGDLNHYQLRVKSHFWKSIENVATKLDPENKNYYSVLVGKIEQQYLLKLFKTENKIQLTAFKDLDLNRVIIKSKRHGIDDKFQDIINDSIPAALLLDKTHARARRIKAIFLQLEFRTLFSFLVIIAPGIKNKNYVLDGLEDFLVDNLQVGNLKTVISSKLEKSINERQVISLLIDTNLFKYGDSFLFNSPIERDNLALFLVYFKLVSELKLHPLMILKYAYIYGIIKHAYYSFNYTTKYSNISEFFLVFSEWVNFHEKTSILSFSRNYVSYVSGFSKNIPLFHGVIRISNNYHVRAEKDYAVNALRYSHIVKRDGHCLRFHLYNKCFTQIQKHTKIRHYASAFQIISTILDLIDIAITNKDFTRDEIEYSIANSKLIPRKQSFKPNIVDKQEASNATDFKRDHVIKNQITGPLKLTKSEEALIKILEHWLRVNVVQSYDISVYIDIFHEVISAFTKLSETALTIKTAMHPLDAMRRISELPNELEPVESESLKNLQSVDYIIHDLVTFFLKTMHEYSVEKIGNNQSDEYELVEWLMLCPLWLVYLVPDRSESEINEKPAYSFIKDKINVFAEKHDTDLTVDKWENINISEILNKMQPDK